MASVRSSMAKPWTSSLKVIVTGIGLIIVGLFAAVETVTVGIIASVVWPWKAATLPLVPLPFPATSTISVLAFRLIRYSPSPEEMVVVSRNCSSETTSMFVTEPVTSPERASNSKSSVVTDVVFIASLNVTRAVVLFSELRL